MFENTINSGSVLGVMFLTYSTNVAIEALRLDLQSQDEASAASRYPRRNMLFTIFYVAAVPATIWIAIYIAGYDGWVSGLVGWIGLQLIGGLATRMLGIKGILIGFHIWIAMAFLPIGYYLTFSTLPW